MGVDLLGSTLIKTEETAIEIFAGSLEVVAALEVREVVDDRGLRQLLAELVTRRSIRSR